MDTKQPKANSSFTYIGKGFVYSRSGAVTISLTDQKENISTAFSVAGGSVEVVTRNTRDERLKATERDEADLLDDFADRFVQAQRRIFPRSKSLSKGDRLIITGIRENEQGELCCKGVGEGDEELVLFDDELVVGTYVRDLLPYLYDDDFIQDACIESDQNGFGVSIRRTYMDFAVRTAQQALKKKSLFKGRVLFIDDKLQRILWMTAGGFLAISRIREGLKPDDEAVLYIVSVQFRKEDTYINVDVDESGGQGKAVQPFEAETLLSGFIMDHPQPEALPDDAAQVRHLAQVLATSKPGGSLEKYRTLLTARFLAEAIQDRALSDEYAHQADILQRKILYAQRKTLRSLENAPTDVECLLHADTPERFLDEPGIPGSIAQLLTVAKAAVAYPDIIPAKADDIRRRICFLLGVEDAFRPSGVLITGKYGLGEGNEVEFKSSYVMRNDGNGPDLDYQGRGQVFEAVCGFLNADGGTLFLGVNDSGDPIVTPHRGLDGDMDWFKANAAHVTRRAMRLLGHRVTIPESMDKFALFLQQEKKIYFKESLQDNITIDPTEDGDAIRIRVKPAEFEIAYLYKDLTRKEGVAYVRDGNQTLPMSEDAKRRRLMSLKRVDKNIEHLVRLQEAIDRKHKVYLRSYLSGNSGSARDRLVVPINLFYDDEKVWCFDLEDRKFKQFNLSRIGRVDTDVPDPEYNHDFKPCEPDAFGWVDKDHDYPICLRMEVIAYNYLVEHFAGIRHLPADQLRQEDENHWILTTTVHSLNPVRWFYLAIADKIEILDSPAAEDLKQEVRSFVETWLQG